MMPKGWEKVKLGDLATYRRGSFPQPYGNPEWIDEINGYPFIQVYDIAKNMKLKQQTKTKISDAATSKSVFIKSGTVIVSLQGSIGRVAITQYDAYVDRTVLLFQQFKRPMNTVYFAYAIQDLFKIEKEKAPGGTIKTITKQALSHFTLVVPTYEEQCKIAKILTTWDSAIATTEKLIMNSKQQRKSLVQQLLTGRKRLINPKTGKMFEEEWEEVKFGDVITHMGGTALEKYVQEGALYHFISIGNYSMSGKYIDKGQRITLNDKTRAKCLNKNDLVMVLNDKTKTGDIIGSTILIDSDDKYIYNQRSERIIVAAGTNVKFFWFLLNSKWFRTEVFNRSQGGTQIYVNFGSLKSIKLKLPSLNEQQKIASVLTLADKEIALLEAKLSHLKQERKALMQQLLTGKRRVKVDKIERT